MRPTIGPEPHPHNSIAVAVWKSASSMRDFHLSMSTPAAPSPQLFFETINAYQKCAALKAAIELGLFTAIGKTPASAAEIAERCSSPVCGVRILSDYLTILGFLTKENGLYALTPDSAVFLDRESPAYVGGTIDFFLASELVDGFKHLTATVRTGTVQHSELGTIAPDHPVWIEFARAMGPMMVPAARGTAALLPLDPSRDTRVLDISASHGTFGLAVGEANPRAQIVALDWAAVLEVAKANAEKAGLADRFSTIIGDAFKVDLGTDYDVILVPNFLHHFNPADCVRFLQRAYEALRPGGKVAIVEFVPNEDRVTPPAAAGFSLVMLGSTPEGDAYTFAEYQQMLTEAGFTGALQHPLPPTAESAILATRP